MQLLIAALYLCFGIIIHLNFISQGIVGVVWPGSGIALAALLIGGRRYIWGVLLGSLLLNLTANHSLWAISGITLANVTEAWVGYWLITRSEQTRATISTLRDYLRLIAMGGATSLIGATIGALSILLAGYIAPAEYLENVSHWWMGDTLGIALLTPLALAWFQDNRARLSGKQWAEAVLLFGIAFIAGQIAFLGWFDDFLSDAPKGYWMFLFVAWVAIRLGTRSVTLLLLMLATQALSGSYHEIGVFSHDIADANLHNYWAYMLILSLIGITLATHVNEITDGLNALKLKDTALNAAANSIVITDSSGRIEWINQAFSQTTGYSPDEARGKNHSVLVKSDKQDSAFYATLWNTVLSGKVWRGELINRRKDGTLHDEEMTITPLLDELGEISHFVAVKQEITGRKQAEKYEQFRSRTLELLAEDEELATLLEAITLGIERINPDALCSILLLDDGRHLTTGAAPSLPDFYNAAIDGLEIGIGVGSCGTAALTGERVIVEDIQTHPYWAPYTELAAQAKLGSCWSQPILSATGRVLGTFAIYYHSAHTPTPADLHLIEQTAHLTSIAIEHKRMVKQVQQLAFYDPLTKLPNRRLLDDRLDQAMASSKRSGRYCALLFLDLDNFKPLNDTYGHGVGDMLLIQAAQRLKNCVRSVDTVARFGGDEFVVLLNELGLEREESVSQAYLTAEKISSMLAQPYTLTTQGTDTADLMFEYSCTASIGVVIFFNHQGSSDDLLKWSDTAMYQAKDAGRNRVRLYHVPERADRII